MSNTFKVEIARCNKQLSAKEKVQIKDTGDAISLDTATLEAEGHSLMIMPAIYAELAVHNEKSANKDYVVFVIIDADGTKYVTSSTSFWNSFTNIADEMADAGEEDFEIKVYRRPSKNYSGKEFITCSLA